MLELLKILNPYAIVISAGSAFISAVAVVISTVFIIWTTHFRKTRRDRIDELKVEMQVKLSQGWTDRIVKTGDMNGFIRSLDSKFQTPEYKKLHQCAYNELAYEGKNEVVNYHVERAKLRRYQYELAQKSASR